MKDEPEKRQYDSYVGQVARGAGISTFSQAIGRVLNYGTQVALARLYGPTGAGFYVLGVTVVWLANVAAQFGLDNGVVRYVARYRAEEDAGRVRGTILLSLASAFVASLVISCILFFGAGFLATHIYDKPFMESVLRVFSVALPLFTLMNTASFALGGFQTENGAHRYGAIVQQILQPGMNLLLIVVSYLLGGRVLGTGFAYAISMGLGTVAALYYLNRVFPKLLDRGTPPKYEPRALFVASGPMVIVNVMPYLSTWAAITVLGIFGTTGQVGIYNAAARTGTLSALILFAFSGIFSPMVSSLHKNGLMDHLGRLFGDVSRWAFTGSLAIFLLTLLLAKDIMAVFGPDFVPGWPALVVIAAAQLFSSSVGLTGRALAMTGHQRMVVLAATISSLAGVVVTIALVPAYGIMGAATAMAAAVILDNAVTLLSVRRLLGLWPYSRLYLKPIVGGALAISVAYAVKLWLPTSQGIPTVLVLTPLFLVSYLTLLFAFGLSVSDQQLLGTFYQAFRRRTVPKKPAA